MENQQGPSSTVILHELLASPRNREAFGKFVAKYHPRINRCCCDRWRLQNADADDLTASILLGFLERDVFSRFVFQSKAKFDGWLGRVVQNAVLRFRRDRGRKPDAWSLGNADAQDSLADVAEEIARDMASICEEDRVRFQEARARVEARVEEKTKEAFRLLQDEERAVEEVCKLLGMTNFAVWKARSRFLRMLREELPNLHGLSEEE